MVKLARILSQLRPFKALVLGDFMLDSYTTGRVKRISPEAPVPVMEVIKQEYRAGGAGNVVLNLASLGATVLAIGRIGADSEGTLLKTHLSEADTTALLVEPGYRTPVKNRLIADSQQLLRIDFETISPLSPSLEEQLIQELPALISDIDVIAISDYGKGFLSNRLLSFVLTLAKEKKIPAIVDPKGLDFKKYKGATIIKPNLSEAYAAAKCPSSATLDEVASELKHLSEYLLITRSEAGISIFDSQGTRSDFPVRSKEVKDVTGAGDTVLAMICLGVANNLSTDVVVELANIAAGLSIERLGCVQITLSELAGRLLEYDSDTKIFDESHLFALQQVLKAKEYSLLVLEQSQAMTMVLFRTICELSHRQDRKLVIYVKHASPDDEFIHLLSSLHEVDYIILQTESLKHLCEVIEPKEIFTLEEGGSAPLSSSRILLEALTSR